MLVKLEWLGYRMVKNDDDKLSRFHTIPPCYRQTDRRTDGQTDRIAISISRVSVLTRDKNAEIIENSAWCHAGCIRLKIISSRKNAWISSTLQITKSTSHSWYKTYYLSIDYFQYFLVNKDFQNNACRRPSVARQTLSHAIAIHSSLQL